VDQLPDMQLGKLFSD